LADVDYDPLRILITGASDGLGYHLARDYAANGHDVLATGTRRISDDRMHFEQAGIAYVRADQSEPQRACAQIAEALDRFGWDRLDLVILNAGMGWAGDPVEEPPETISAQIAINLTAPVAISHMLAPHLFATGGKLALIGSTASIKGNPAFATYSASKAALDAFARALREEWKGKAEVIMLHPGPIRTDMHEKAGLKLGGVRRLFMKPERAARAIERAIRNDDKSRILTRSYGWRSIFSKAREGEL